MVGEALASALAAVLFAVAAAFGSAAGFLALMEAYGAIIACGIMAGAFAALGLIVIVAASVVKSRRKRKDGMKLVEAGAAATIISAFLSGYRSTRR